MGSAIDGTPLLQLEDLATVRPLLPADRPAWLRLWAAYQAEGRQGAAPLPLAVTEACWDRLLAPQVPLHGLLLLLEGRAAGFAHLALHPHSALRGCACWLQDLFVEPARRGQGLGQLLLAASRRRAEAAGAERLYWHVAPGQAAAQRFCRDLSLPGRGALHSLSIGG
ncbi:GNAT family N-acetyltransferase [Pseudoroseomonas cervicalis]|uniref:GNAT family N-acetyltransferase n=1 Tax=Teichococcus cervicalis TaxID=204525 RepID=UPI0027831DA6|nr:GNAT family N-acetyltransferase [Pseudoroseomonas cervicalis]MDQ1077957.1 GNAT superfamily N-acetyltransferase [Pseudoroseomonas cervicalis]